MVFRDFLKDAYGYLSVELVGTPGTQIQWAVGEVSDGQKINREPGGHRVFRSGTLLLEEGKTHYQISFPKHPSKNPAAQKSPFDWEIAPFRYAEIHGDCSVLDICRHEVFPENFSDDDSFFESSNENLNRIWEFCKYSIKATAPFGIFIDGERERLPYEGDAYINQAGWFACCADPEIPRKTIEFFKEHPTWPTEWNIQMPIIVRDYWLYTGDRASVDRWLEWLPEKLLPELWDANGFVRGNGTTIRDIVDWPVTERDDYEFGEVNFVPNAYLIQALKAMKELTGEEQYLIQAEKLRRQLKKYMFCNGLPVDHPASTHTALHTAIFALWADIAEDTAPLIKMIREKGMGCSVYGAQFLLEVCFRHDFADHGLALMTSDDLRSWNNMLKKGSSITMEAWDDSFKPNQDWNHAWGAAPCNIIPHYLCGLRPVKPGFEEYSCQPAALAVDWKLKHPVPGGCIMAEYVKGKLSCRKIKKEYF